MPSRLLLALSLALTLAGCNGQATTAPSTASANPAPAVAEPDTDPSTALPTGVTSGNPITPDTGVVGVTHIAP